MSVSQHYHHPSQKNCNNKIYLHKKNNAFYLSSFTCVIFCERAGEKAVSCICRDELSFACGGVLQLINQTVLSNKRAYADLYARLMMADIEREKKLHTQWKQRMADWKTLHIDKAVFEFQ